MPAIWKNKTNITTPSQQSLKTAHASCTFSSCTSQGRHQTVRSNPDACGRTFQLWLDVLARGCATLGCCQGHFHVRALSRSCDVTSCSEQLPVQNPRNLQVSTTAARANFLGSTWNQLRSSNLLLPPLIAAQLHLPASSGKYTWVRLYCLSLDMSQDEPPIFPSP